MEEYKNVIEKINPRKGGVFNSCELDQIGDDEKLVDSGVIDGDTFFVREMHTGRVLKVRLFGVNAPEKGATGFDEAKAFIEKSFKEGLNPTVLVASQNKRPYLYQTDRYGRVLGTVFIGGRDIAKEMLEKGLVELYA